MRTKKDDSNEVLNLTEAARFIRVSEKTMRQMARTKRVPCRKVGREWRFLHRGLEQWLAGSLADSVVAEQTQAYQQTALFPEAGDASDAKPAFGDTAFTRNRRDPIHRWVPWIAGFSASFVEEVLKAAISGSPRTGFDRTGFDRTGFERARTRCAATVLDPFAGVGTTLVEGLKLGCNAIGFEINPYAALACEVKLACVRCRLEQLTAAINEVEALRRSETLAESQPASTPPGNFRSKTRFFSPAIERQVLLIQDLIADQPNGFVKKLLNLALGSVMVGFSNYSYEPSLGTRAAAGKENVESADVLGIFCDKLWEMEADIGFLQQHMKRFEHKPAAVVHRRSYLSGSDVLPAGTVDVLITSPPYLNNYHYVRNTRPQRYWLGLVESSGHLKQLEEESFGQFWQTSRAAPQIDLAFEHPELQKVLQCIREQNPGKGVYGGSGWANYAATYFNDCNRFFEVTRRVMKPGGWVVIVIGNNIVQGVHVETDRFLAEIGERHGFRLAGMHRVRRKRTGSSIVNSSVRVGVTKKRTELYETAVEMRAL